MSCTRRARRTPVPAFVTLGLAGLTLLSGGCSSSGSSSQPGAAPVASLSGHGSGTGAAGQLTQAQSDHDMISFAHCMRAHGVQMADPFHVPGHSGLSIDLPTRDSATANAYQACFHFISRIVAAKNAGAAAQAAANLPALTAYARCMRAHDIAMLDPDPQGELNLGSVPGITSDFGRKSPQFRAADRACRHLLPPTVNDDGTGP
jgi:hypothetical protein